MGTRQIATPAHASLPGLALHATAARAEALLKERERLLREVNKKKQLVERAREKSPLEAQASVAKMAPLVERHGVLVRELTALFDELLVEGRLSARARTQVRKLRSSLEHQGYLSPLTGLDEDEVDPAAGDSWHVDEPSEPWSETGAGHSSTGKTGRRSQGSGAANPSVRDVASARQPAPERRSSRDVFRGLARAVHPNRARQESEKQRRTQVMKEATRAYEEGDLARLLELESAWHSERALAGEGDPDPEARCRELERINRELLDQVRRLTRELRDVKRDARAVSPGPLEEVVEQAARELDDFASVCELVRGFRDGKITLAEFARGPH